MTSIPKYRGHVAFTLIGAAILAQSAYSQSSVASYNGVHAIVGARIEIGDGRVIEKGTVVVKDGIIVAVAADAAVPRGAEVLDGKGLIVYPGFIDAYTTKGYTAPAVPSRSAQVDPNGGIANFASAFMRDVIRPGITPEDRASANLSLGDDVVKPYLNAGFTTILVAPSGGDISGVAALVNLSGRPSRECVVLPTVGQAFGFGGRSAGYPSSLMGHIAQMRQTLLDAQWYGSVKRSFEAGGAKRPPSDEVLIALQPVVGGQLPALFDADSDVQIGRALDICAEFSMKPFIVGVGEGWKRLDEIKKSNAVVLLSLPFGKEPGASPPPPTPPALAPSAPPATTPVVPAAATTAETEPENPSKVAERKRLYKESVKNASVLGAAGISFAFTTKGTANPGAFMENLRKAIEAGLSKEAALKALTIDAAKAFGVERQLGSIEVGKTANIVVTSEDFTSAKMKVKMLYIDGRKIDPGKNPTPSTPQIRFGKEVGR